MPWARYNKAGRLTLFGLSNRAEILLWCVLGMPFGLLGFGLPGCAETTVEQPRITGKYRVVQIYGVNEYGSAQWTDYATDAVKYDGPWVKFYDKGGGRWTRLSGQVLVEGGED